MFQLRIFHSYLKVELFLNQPKILRSRSCLELTLLLLSNKEHRCSILLRISKSLRIVFLFGNFQIFEIIWNLISKDFLNFHFFEIIWNLISKDLVGY